MKRIKFPKGEQRKFLKEVLGRINCPSLRELIQRGFDVPYSTLKNYFNESRALPEDFFRNLIILSKINEKDLDFEILEDNWGQKIGGKKSKRKIM